MEKKEKSVINIIIGGRYVHAYVQIKNGEIIAMWINGT